MNKLSKLRKFLNIYKLDGYIVPKNDEFFGEYVDQRNDRLNYISSFSGSALPKKRRKRRISNSLGRLSSKYSICSNT